VLYFSSRRLRLAGIAGGERLSSEGLSVVPTQIRLTTRHKIKKGVAAH
jgi:hypothetical protein